ncbi:MULTISPECIES: GNAT family N-acetyltransferase [Staphylococcus]|jgi:ElaA protein|uniref:GNAT family N-acetyltransferase n=1 Tax=Staphylococcus TaxID=1279 RepID=UPI000BC3067B|nr:MULTISPECIES: GNAT family N-acetyltransferase [Staphylococcus]ATH60738.1 GNAT family N-acetyltransferase [Staphylococcus nepalensis]ATH65785.1 GNAT family N-acetyltransferase [Staphylococcus nepalensis]AWI45161.1 GNAT family N-acetyltransferase [Staphylococcus nepalensis]NWN84325.1 GNAT family N-acetyltransferase [Staphylococcus sp.]WQL19648.1 GNAT family N-acetyltransferase [Staphylococcus nepalensis]
MSKVRLEVKYTEELSNIELLEILKERVKIFVVEQKCIYQEIDDKDRNAQHVILYDENNIIAYTRIVTSENGISFGRVLVTQNYRKKGYGREIVQCTIDIIKKQYHHKFLKISGQAHLKTFYESFGFQANSKTYMEDGIPHIEFMMYI